MTTAVLTHAPTLGALLRAPVTSAALASYLDGLDQAGRLREARSLGGGLQKKLWDACADAAPLTLEEFLPSSLPDGKLLAYGGRNSLPLFSLFEKRFTRQGGAVIGYNQSGVSGLTGPGYFAIEAGTGARAKELLFDYERVPARAPAGQPPVQSNDRGLARLVFGGLHDFCRRVATGVVIGEATRRGQPMGAYFVLARMPGQAVDGAGKTGSALRA